ncbi:MAG: GntR family transcriptional regulator [Firmicutes bacterium HGW-Firmicutes-12]|nr:MAG: GntR family transcriptional regulator [Firmicutes bacterium HGW-Firmicutes-12]
MDIIISNSSPEPIYEQIVRQIRNQIITGQLLGDEPLPSIRNLAWQLQISVITSKRAYEELEREGLIVTVGGKGSFVSSQNKDTLREKRYEIIKEKLVCVVKEAKLLSISLQELEEMLKHLYKEA